MPSEFDRLSDSNDPRNAVAGTNSDSGKESDDASEESAGSQEEEGDYEDDDDESESEAEELYEMMEAVGDSITLPKNEMEAANAEILKRQNNLQFQKVMNRVQLQHLVDFHGTKFKFLKLPTS